MIIAVLVILGLCFGSFVNALVWRVHEQAKPKGKRAASDAELSIATGRSMCPHCKHTLGAMDLLPLVSWLLLRGKCRYCRHKIDDTPVTEAVLPVFFAGSYIFWPLGFGTSGKVAFAVWLVTLIFFAALFLYDIRWMLLPDRVVYPLIGFAAAHVLVQTALAAKPWHYLLQAVVSMLIAGGIFYVLFQVSDGKWIGGGDVKLGYALGLTLADPAKALLMLFTASMLGVLFALPSMLSGKMKPTTRMPFGPFLILATVVVYLFGADAIAWYTHQFLFV